MTTIYKVSKKLWIDHSKEINPELETDQTGGMTRLDNLINVYGANPFNNPDIETIRKDELKKVMDNLEEFIIKNEQCYCDDAGGFFFIRPMDLREWMKECKE